MSSMMSDFYEENYLENEASKSYADDNMLVDLDNQKIPVVVGQFDHLRKDNWDEWQDDLPQFKVAICGHSFIKRQRDFILEDKSNKYFANMKMQEAYIRWICRGGWTWDLFDSDKKGWQEVKEYKPDLVFIELGTNDLDSFDSVSKVVQKAKRMVDKMLSIGIKKIVIAHVIPRGAKGRYVQLHKLNDKISDYNDTMKQEFINESVPKRSPYRFWDNRVWFWEHKGLRSSQYELLRRDGVHLSAFPALDRHYHSVRLAILSGLRDLSTDRYDVFN